MPMNKDFIGRSYLTPDSYQVGREKIREFALAIGDRNPAYHSVQAARALGHPDLVAPPTFAFVLTFRGMLDAVGDRELGLDYSRVVHGEQHFTYTRPIVAGDELVVESVIENIATVRSNELLTIRQDVNTIAGELVVTTRNVTVSRGTAPAESKA